MQDSSMKQPDTASNHSDAGMTGMKNGIKFIVTGALLLAASSAVAGIIYLPVSGRYQAPELAPTNIQILGDESFRIHTTGLTSEWTIQGSDFPPGYDVPAAAQVALPSEQKLELFIDIAEGSVSGRFVSQSMDRASTLLAATAEVRGHASCLPRNGFECGQLVVDLEVRGVLSDPNDPAVVGQLRMEMLGSLFFDGSDVGFWAAMSANTTIGGNRGLINSVSHYAACNGALVIC